MICFHESLLHTLPLSGLKRLQPLRALAMDEPSNPRGFWSLRWHGRLPLSQLFWREAMGVNRDAIFQDLFSVFAKAAGSNSV